MKERPILFSAPMVRAILAGTKTQTRRVVKPRLNKSGEFLHAGNADLAHKKIHQWRVQEGRWFGLAGYTTLAHADCPYGQPSDRLWVRETWGVAHDEFLRCESEPTFWRADYSEDELATQWLPRWRPSIHMPRSRSRISLEITGVHIQRLQHISRGEALVEGCQFPNMNGVDGITDPVGWYRNLWESLNGPGSWDANPWVWAIEFERVVA